MKKQFMLLLVVIIFASIFPADVVRARIVSQLPSASENEFELDTLRIEINLAHIREHFIAALGDGVPSVWFRLTLTPNRDEVGNYATFALSERVGAHAAVTVPPYASINAATITQHGATQSGINNFELLNDPIITEYTVHDFATRNPVRAHTIEFFLAFDPNPQGNFTPSPMPTGITGNVRFDIGLLVVGNTTATLDIDVVSQVTGEVVRNVLRNGAVIPVRPTPGVEFSIENNASDFKSALILPQIFIQERIRGSILPEHTATVRLIAPYDYMWNAGIYEHLLGNRLRLEPRNVAFSPEAIYGTVTGYGVVSNFDARHFIDVSFPIPARDTRPGSGTARARFAMSGLALVPSGLAPTSGAVNIDIGWVPARGPAHQPTHIAVSCPAVIYDTTVGWHANWRRTGFTVGYRHGNVISISTMEDIPVLVSGVMGWPTSGMPPPSTRLDGFIPQTRPPLIAEGYGVNFDLLAAPDDIRTARVKISELAAGGFNTGFLSAIVDFTFPEGVHIVHAAFAFHNGDNRVDIGEVDWTPVPASEFTEHAGYSGIRVSPPVFLGGVPYIAENKLRLFVPRNDNPLELRQLEVYFWLSVQAGFEHKNGNEIFMEVTGPAVEHLEETTVLVANVQDPVQMQLDGGIIYAETGRTHNLMERTRIGDIVISETSHGRLRHGDEIWLYVVGTNIQRPGRLALHTSSSAVIMSGNLQLSAAQPLSRTLPGGMNVTGVRFQVLRPSTYGNESVIRITENYLFGEILPGQEYVLVLSGPRLAANEFQIVAPAVTRNTLGVFDSHPYAVTVIEWGGFDRDVMPPAEVEEPPHVHTRRTFSATTVLTIDGHPIRAVIFSPVGGVRVAKMSGRVFTDFVGGAASWDAENYTAIFSGYNRHGEFMEVELTLGDSRAVVNGAFIDIATGAGQPQFAGEIVPVIYEERLYVPVRFLANMFGVPVTSSGGGESMLVIMG